MQCACFFGRLQGAGGLKNRDGVSDCRAAGGLSGDFAAQVARPTWQPTPYGILPSPIRDP